MEVLPRRDSLAQTDSILHAAEAALLCQFEQLGAMNTSLISVEKACKQIHATTRQSEAKAAGLRDELTNLQAAASELGARSNTRSTGTAALLARAVSDHAERSSELGRMAMVHRGWEKQIDQVHFPVSAWPPHSYVLAHCRV